MQLRRIEIRDFRKLGHALIENIGDGLSVVVGENEAGKSTVLAALRAALFERHRGTGESVRRMLPYGQIVRPEVRIDFDLAGTRYMLRKAFHQRPEAELSWGHERISGDAVEERLSELFGFIPPGRGESKREEHQGLYGLLWVEQGHSHRSLGIGGGRETLASALETEVGQLIGGDRGRALLATAAERRESFWGRNDKPRGAYRQIGETLDKLESRRREVLDNLRQLDDKVALLAAKQEALDRHARDDRLAAAVETVKRRRAAVDHLAVLERARDAAAIGRDRAEQDRLFAAERQQRRRETTGQVAAAESEVERRLAEARETHRVLTHRQSLAETDEKTLAERRQARLDAETCLRHRQEAFDRQRRSAALAGVEQRLARAETHAAARRETLAAVADITIDPQQVAVLESLERRAEQARATLDTASVHIAFEPEPGRRATLDGADIPTGAPLRLSRDGVLALDGFGRMTIRPGGGVEALARAADAAAAALESALRDIGVARVAHAKEAVARRREAETEAAADARLIKAVAPEGIDALRQAVESERAVLCRMPLRDETEVSEADLTVARDLVEHGRQAEAAADTTASVSLRDRDLSAQHHAIASDRVITARAELESRRAELGSGRAQVADEVLRDREAEALRTVATAAEAAQRAEADIVSHDPETLRLDLDRAEQAERVIRADIEQLRTERRDLEVELNAMGQAGLGEELAELDGRIEGLGREKAVKDLEARASRLLHETLAEAQRESKERWLGPVRERVKPYLRFLEPDSDVLLNEETLEIEGLMRRGIAEPFGALSVGAREQVAVITRLALADILRTAGRPSVLILDDALVNSDEGRLERMHRVLQTAAKTLQVVVLTCRERDFVGLGDLKRL